MSQSQQGAPVLLPFKLAGVAQPTGFLGRDLGRDFVSGYLV
jgi:hypothetical protein